MAIEASDPLDRWLSTLDSESLRTLIGDARRRVPDLGGWLDTQRVASSDDPAELRTIVDRALTPHRRFYDYWQANEYAAQCHDVVDLLARRALHSAPALIPVIERAITLTTRAILKSDDSSGAQGDVVHTLLDAHATAARTASAALTQAEQTRLVKWIIKYRYDGKQDFFDPDIVAYAPGLSEKSIQQYRQAIAAIDLGEYGKYPFTRLAVLDRDRDAIVTANGGEPTNALVAATLVGDLEEAGLHADALGYARIGIALDGRGWDQKLVTFLVDDAFTRADHEDAVALRRDWFHHFPGSSAFASLRDTAIRANLWSRERDDAEALLKQRDAAAFISHLLGEERVDEAWNFAIDRDSPASHPTVWLNLAERRALTHPADTLPIYREIVTETLTVTDKRNYRSAASILKTMRAVAADADAEADFDSFLAETVEQNRRRPTCIDVFVRAGLIARL